MDVLLNYYDFLMNIFQKVKMTQFPNIEKAAEMIFQALKAGGRFLVTGTGHSHMIAEEFYARAGGFAQVCPILPTEFMLHEHPLKSTEVERISEYAEVIMKLYKIKAQDVIMIVSNSGRNGMIVELSRLAKEAGTKVIALTNIKHSKSELSRHPSGKRLYDFADIVIDNCGEHGDAAFQFEGLETPMGATSTAVGAFIAQAVSILLAKKFIDNNMEAPVFKSSNVDGGDEWNNILFSKYYNL